MCLSGSIIQEACLLVAYQGCNTVEERALEPAPMAPHRVVLLLREGHKTVLKLLIETGWTFLDP